MSLFALHSALSSKSTKDGQIIFLSLQTKAKLQISCLTASAPYSNLLADFLYFILLPTVLRRWAWHCGTVLILVVVTCGTFTDALGRITVVVVSSSHSGAHG